MGRVIHLESIGALHFTEKCSGTSKLKEGNVKKAYHLHVGETAHSCCGSLDCPLKH